MSKAVAISNSESLSARIERAAQMVYLEGANEAQLSKALGIKGVTVRDWKKRPEWSQAIETLRAHQEELILNKLSCLSEKAVETVRECLDSDNDGVRLKAAQWILERGTALSGDTHRKADLIPSGSVEEFVRLVVVDGRIRT